MNTSKIPVGISQCLLGAPVRYNAGHKQSKFCTEVLNHYFEFKGICPEVGIGLPTPRETIRLISNEIETIPAPHTKAGHIRQPNNIRLVNSSDGSVDHTEKMQDYSQRVVKRLGNLRGYIFMQNSPSCGLHKVKVYNDHGYPDASAKGVFAQALVDKWPNMPVEEIGRLSDPVIREHFMTQVLAYNDLLNTVEAENFAFKDLLALHTRYKYLLLAHDANTYKELGQLLAQGKPENLTEFAQRYITLFMKGIKKQSKRTSHVNVLMHLQGHFKKMISSQERQAIRDIIEKYAKGLVPLVVPMTMIKHYLSRFPEPFATAQVYLQPHPEQLGLRNAL